MLKIFIICIIICTFSCCKSEKIRHLPCDSTDPKGLCKINEITINPCKEALQNKPCVLRKGVTATININIEALKPIETLKGKPFGVVMGSEAGWAGVDENACNYINCPIAVNANETYSFQFKLQNHLTSGMFYIKLKFWDDTKEGCCRSFYVKLL